MTSDHDLDLALLARFCSGEASPEEVAAVDAWVAADPRHRAELSQMQEWWAGAGSLPSLARVDAMWSSLSGRMRAADGAPNRDRTPAKRNSARVMAIEGRRAQKRPVHLARWVLAASILGVAALGVRQLSSERQPADQARRSGAEATLERRLVTGRGERSTLRLADGTRVELGYSSTLRVRPFDDGRRELWLDGEASFDVVHDERRPFVVHAGGATTEDLGTSFVIRAYGGEGVRVVVMSGKVSLAPTGATTASARRILGPGELGRLRPGGQVEVVRGIDTTHYLGWLGGRIAFQSARLDEVAAELERRFDARVRIPDADVAARRVTLLDMPARSLGEVLDAVTVPLDLRQRRENGVVFVER